jgi:hypothetical protein
MEEVGMPKHKVNRFGRVDDFAGLEAKDVQSFVSRCSSIVSDGAPFSAPIQGIIELGRRHGARVLLVEMPMPSRHRNVFYSTPSWGELESLLETQARNSDVNYLRAADWIAEDKKFEDATHLNPDGARQFSSKLGAFSFQLCSGATSGIASAADR